MDKFNKNYDVLELINKTNGSELYECIPKAGTMKGVMMAVKITDKGGDSDPRGEIAMLTECQHERIIKLFDIFETPERFYIVLELLAGGDLFDKIIAKTSGGNFSEREAVEIIR